MLIDFGHPVESGSLFLGEEVRAGMQSPFGPDRAGRRSDRDARAWFPRRAAGISRARHRRAGRHGRGLCPGPPAGARHGRGLEPGEATHGDYRRPSESADGHRSGRLVPPTMA